MTLLSSLQADFVVHLIVFFLLLLLHWGRNHRAPTATQGERERFFFNQSRGGDANAAGFPS